ncbi:MAG: AmmeMemoRadiSam system protein B [Candidatus Kapabacteria bacterium]|nr:AmmeMemoRadiSam system protein B [Candidatus Kapabacteria bacterium]
MKYIISVALIAAFLNFSFAKDALDMKQITYRPARAAGTFYPENPDSLRSMLKTLEDNSKPARLNYNIQALIVPHAGYIYSGTVAARAYKELYGRNYDAVIIVGPSHFASFSGSSVFNGDAYITPLGNAMVDTALANDISSNKGIQLSLIGHNWRDSSAEHSVEVQIPFIQTYLPNVKIIPIVMGTQDSKAISDLTKAIVTSVKNSKKNILLVASSDLSHYKSRTGARQIDIPLAETISRYDYFKFMLNCFSDRYQACGYGPISVVMMAAEQLGANYNRVLNYATSADSPLIKTPNDRVVGYVSSALINATGADSTKTFPALPTISQENRDRLFEVAKKAIFSSAKNDSSQQSPMIPRELALDYASFVTIKKNGQLRGCMGHIFSTQSIVQEIEETARMAAKSDPRFPALKASELDSIKIEISILSRFKRVMDYHEIEPGKDGVYIMSDGRSGLFLPQVATEQGWNRKALLENLGLKAGLSTDSYLAPNAELYIFRTLVLE